jgi:hypothetical protein
VQYLCLVSLSKCHVEPAGEAKKHLLNTRRETLDPDTRIRKTLEERDTFGLSGMDILYNVLYNVVYHYFNAGCGEKTISV